MTLAEDQRLNTLLFRLLKRLDQSYDGMAHLMPVHDPLWNNATIHHLHEAGLLKKGQSLRTILCNGCPQLCPMPVQHHLDDTGKTESSFIVCDKSENIGIVPVEASAVQPYALTLETLAAMVAGKFGTDRRPEELEAGRLWFLGKEGFGKEKRSIYLFSGAARPDAEIFLRDHSHVAQQAQPIILTPAATLAIPSAVNASLQNLMAIENGALQFDIKNLRHNLQKRQQPPKGQHLVSYDADRNYTLINGQYVLSHPRSDEENERIIQYLCNRPNEVLKREELGNTHKNLSQIIGRLGFEGKRRQAFFTLRKNTVQFHNPVTPSRLKDLGIEPAEILSGLKNL